MTYRSLLPPILIAAFLVGCSLPEPYVFRENEFDRTRSDFAQEPKDLESVRICYNKRNASAEKVRDLALDACGRYGKTAAFIGHERLECPVLVPAAARFACVAR